MLLQEDVSMPEEEEAAASKGAEAAAEAAAAEEAMSEDEVADGTTPQKRKEAPADVVGFHHLKMPSLEAWASQMRAVARECSFRLRAETAAEHRHVSWLAGLHSQAPEVEGSAAQARRR